MSEAVVVEAKKPSKGTFIAGWIVTGLVGAALLASGIMKFSPATPEMEKGLEHIGMTPAHVRPLAFLELGCTLLYLIPQTAVLGAILLTGYMGGAICTHWRVGDPFIVQATIGVLVWLGIFLRDRRLWVLLPFRR